MIYSNVIGCRGFALCYGGMTANESFTSQNLTAGEFNQLIFLYSGLVIVSSEGMPDIHLKEKEFVDVSVFFGKPIKFTAGPQGVVWLAINPHPVEKRFDVQLITQGPVEVKGSEKETAIICVDKTILCNEKELNPLQYVRVLNNKTVNLTIPASDSLSGIAAIVTEK
jgi:hypothetical protein